ncbi:unnamed protein product [Amoebophrya sp. A120]|nr:unnamed protein product [Amoebophrya sp. A120]|eukprot:GSA120T00024071001.1
MFPGFRRLEKIQRARLEREIILAREQYQAEQKQREAEARREENRKKAAEARKLQLAAKHVRSGSSTRGAGRSVRAVVSDEAARFARNTNRGTTQATCHDLVPVAPALSVRSSPTEKNRRALAIEDGLASSSLLPSLLQITDREESSAIVPYAGAPASGSNNNSQKALALYDEKEFALCVTKAKTSAGCSNQLAIAERRRQAEEEEQQRRYEAECRAAFLEVKRAEWKQRTREASAERRRKLEAKQEKSELRLEQLEQMRRKASRLRKRKKKQRLEQLRQQALAAEAAKKQSMEESNHYDTSKLYEITKFDDDDDSVDAFLGGVNTTAAAALLDKNSTGVPNAGSEDNEVGGGRKNRENSNEKAVSKAHRHILEVQQRRAEMLAARERTLAERIRRKEEEVSSRLAEAEQLRLEKVDRKRQCAKKDEQESVEEEGNGAHAPHLEDINADQDPSRATNANLMLVATTEPGGPGATTGSGPHEQSVSDEVAQHQQNLNAITAKKKRATAARRKNFSFAQKRYLSLKHRYERMKEALFKSKKFLAKPPEYEGDEDAADQISPTDLMNLQFGGAAAVALQSTETANESKRAKNAKLAPVLPAVDAVWKELTATTAHIPDPQDVLDGDSAAMQQSNKRNRRLRCGLCELEFSEENLPTRITHTRVEKLRADFLSRCEDEVLLNMDYEKTGTYDKVPLCAFCLDIAKFHIENEKI